MIFPLIRESGVEENLEERLVNPVNLVVRSAKAYTGVKDHRIFKLVNSSIVPSIVTTSYRSEQAAGHRRSSCSVANVGVGRASVSAGSVISARASAAILVRQRSPGSRRRRAAAAPDVPTAPRLNNKTTL